MFAQHSACERWGRCVAAQARLASECAAAQERELTAAQEAESGLAAERDLLAARLAAAEKRAVSHMTPLQTRLSELEQQVRRTPSFSCCR